MTEKLNFIMTGSIAGGRGLEALLVLKQLPLVTPNYGRCIVVVWEKEAVGDVFEEIRRYPVKVVIAKEPKRTSFGFMEQQYKSLLAAMPYFDDDEVLVRIRTDYNFVLRSTIGFLDKIIAQGRSVARTLRGRIVCGEISILHPGRIQEFNFAATKKSLSMIGWCESFFTTDYNPVDMEPEFRWFGLQFVQADPLFHYCYENRNMRPLMRHFFDSYNVGCNANPDEFPSIVKYMCWRISNIALQKFICCLNLGGRNVAPEVVFNAKRADVSVYHDNIPDIRLTCHSTLADIADIAPASPKWKSFVAEAKDVLSREKRAPGTTIELFERTFPPNEQAGRYGRSSMRFQAQKKMPTETPLSRFVADTLGGQAVFFSSFRDYPSDILLGLRKANLEPTLLVAKHIILSEGLHDQMINRYTSFCVTVFCALISQKQFEVAGELLCYLADVEADTNISELVNVVANRSKRFPIFSREKGKKLYEVPEKALDYNMLQDFYCSLYLLQQAKLEVSCGVVDVTLALIDSRLVELE